MFRNYNIVETANSSASYTPQETEAEMEDEVDILMSSDIVAAQMSTKQITFSRAQTGWIFRADKKVCWMLLLSLGFKGINRVSMSFSLELQILIDIKW